MEGAAQPGMAGQDEGRDRVSFLEQALWKRLGDATTRQEFAGAWLAIQCKSIDGVSGGIVVLDAGAGTAVAPVALWPDEGIDTARLQEAANAAVAAGRGVVKTPSGSSTESEGSRGGAPVCLAYPVIVDDVVRGAAALQMDSDNGRALRANMRYLQWGVSWLRERLQEERIRADEKIIDRSSTVLDVAAATLQELGFGTASRAAVTELASRMACDRVSMGFHDGDKTTVRAISHSADFGKQMNLVRMLGAAMDEAVEQQAVVLFPARDEDVGLTRAHAELARAHGAGTILTVPLLSMERCIGALTFERPADHPFTVEEIELLACVAPVIGPILEDKRLNDRWIGAKIVESLKHLLTGLLGQGHWGIKLSSLAFIAIAVVLTFAGGNYRVTAKSEIEGLVRRSVVASVDGYIREAPARAGDKVERGQLMAALDDRDLELERLRWVTEKQRQLHEYNRARGQRDPVQANIIKAQLDQTDVQIALIDEKLSRVQLRAPFDGLVISGDLSQAIGSSVRRGDVLFEVAPLDAYRVILRVDETQIADVKVGQTGHMVVASLPEESFRLRVDKITPVAEPSEGRNTFRVEARLEEAPTRLRPGMEGVAKINIERRNLVWIWTRGFLGWLRLQAWRWLP